MGFHRFPQNLTNAQCSSRRKGLLTAHAHAHILPHSLKSCHSLRSHLQDGHGDNCTATASAAI